MVVALLDRSSGGSRDHDGTDTTQGTFLAYRFAKAWQGDQHSTGLQDANCWCVWHGVLGGRRERRMLMGPENLRMQNFSLKWRTSLNNGVE